MKLLIFIVIGIVAGLLVLAGIIALIGSRLPKSHVASRFTYVDLRKTFMQSCATSAQHRNGAQTSNESKSKRRKMGQFVSVKKQSTVL